MHMRGFWSHLDLVLEVLQVAHAAAVLKLLQLGAQAFRERGSCPSVQGLNRGRTFLAGPPSDMQ